MIQLVPLIF